MAQPSESPYSHNKYAVKASVCRGFGGEENKRNSNFFVFNIFFVKIVK